LREVILSGHWQLPIKAVASGCGLFDDTPPDYRNADQQTDHKNPHDDIGNLKKPGFITFRIRRKFPSDFQSFQNRFLQPEQQHARPHNGI
jgi:hypothetical protein